jgi:hypothetical protein
MELAMKPMLWLAAAAALLALCLPAAPAQAIPRTFVSSTGSGAACTRAAPCATFQAAHDVTDPGGEINCIDAGNFGPVGLIITKPITIDCAGTLGSMSGFTPEGITINVPGGVVRLRNLTIDGTGTHIGINFPGRDHIASRIGCRQAVRVRQHHQQ